MDESTLNKIAEFICGNGEQYPVYRSSSQLTAFFERAGLPQFVHDGSTRQWWVLECLKRCSREELAQVLKRLASPREYSGNKEQITSAIQLLNEAVYVEGFRIMLRGVDPYFERIEVNFNIDEDVEQELQPLPPPNFLTLGLEPGIGELLGRRWDEAQKCVDSESFLAATIIMGSMLEGLLLGVCQRYPKEANTTPCTPKDSSGKVLKFHEWSLSQMIDVAHHAGWIDLDVKKFSHSLRDFRNLIHPYEQMLTGANPDSDTCKISWFVVQAAVNDLAEKLK
jgi:hypothetical protein